MMNDELVRRYIDISMFKTKKLSSFMKYYRILGFCYYDNNGQPKLIYKAYCFAIFALHLLLISFLVSTYRPEQYFTSLSAVQQIPFFLKQLLRVIHVLVATIWILRNNPLIKDFYNCMSNIQEGIKSTKLELRSDFFYSLTLSFPQFCLVFITSGTFAMELGNNYIEKIDTFFVFMFTFPVYVMEEWLMLTMLTTRNTLIRVNEVFRNFRFTIEDIKHFRTIHTQLVVLNLQVNDHFRLMITTWLISSAMILWASGFQIITMLMSAHNPAKYLLVTFSVDALHHLSKMMIVCYFCESVKEEVRKKCVSRV